MAKLQTTIDYKSIKEVKDLPVSWISTHGQDVMIADNYLKECKLKGLDANPARIAELIGSNIAHLRQTTLENGLRYVTIHLEDGRQIFNDNEYTILTDSYSRMNHDISTVAAARVITGTNLGDGLKLQMIISGESQNYTRSVVEKKFKSGQKHIELNYILTPERKNENGHLMFSYEENTQGLFCYNPKNMNRRGRYAPKTYPIIVKHQKIMIDTKDTRETGDKIYPYCLSSIMISHHLFNNPYMALDDTIEFKFGIDGKLHNIKGISKSYNPNPEWTDDRMLDVIMKGQNKSFNYSAKDPEAKILIEAIFGQDITRLTHHTRNTLNAIMQAAIKEEDIDFPKTMKFQ